MPQPGFTATHSVDMPNEKHPLIATAYKVTHIQRLTSHQLARVHNGLQVHNGLYHGKTDFPQPPELLINSESSAPANLAEKGKLYRNVELEGISKGH